MGIGRASKTGSEARSSSSKRVQRSLRVLLELGVDSPRRAQEDVEVVRLDDVPLRGLDLVKIDVESMELDLLQGAERTLAAFRPVIYVEDSPRFPWHGPRS